MKIYFIVLLFLTSLLFASYEIQTSRSESETVYAIIRKTSDLTVWQTTTSTFVAWADANIANYDVALTDKSGDVYAADFPSGITIAGDYRANIYSQLGGSPDINDILIDYKLISWNGTSEITLYAIWADTNETQGKLPTDYIAGSATQSDIADSYGRMNLGRIGDNNCLYGSTDAILSLEQIYIKNDEGIGFYVESSSTNGVEFRSSSAGSAGLYCVNANGGKGLFADGSTGDITGNITGNLTGNITGNLTGNITGNLSGTIGSLSATAKANVGDAVLDELVTDHNDVNSLGEMINFINDISEGDTYIDTDTTPWQMVIKIKGTETELVRKELKDINGDNLTNISTVIGQSVEP